jgi:hypothetical protein
MKTQVYSLDPRRVETIRLLIIKLVHNPNGLPNGKNRRKRLTPLKARRLKDALMWATQQAAIFGAHGTTLPDRLQGGTARQCEGRFHRRYRQCLRSRRTNTRASICRRNRKLSGESLQRAGTKGMARAGYCAAPPIRALAEENTSNHRYELMTQL